MVVDFLWEWVRTVDIPSLYAALTVLTAAYMLYSKVQRDGGLQRERSYKELKFIKEFVDDLNENAHPFVLEKGFGAISGSYELEAQEIKYLMSMPSPSQALSKYKGARSYLELRTDQSNLDAKIVFRERYSERRIRWTKRCFVFLYFLFSFLAFLPIIFSNEIFGKDWKTGLVTIVSALLLFGFFAINSLLDAVRINKANDLVTLSQVMSERATTH